MQPQGPPRIVEWRGQHYFFYYKDGKQVRRSCARMNAHTDKARRRKRKELEQKLELHEASRLVERTVLGVAYATDTLLVDSLEDYGKYVKRRLKARTTDLERRAGLSKASAVEIERTLTKFTAWLESAGLDGLTTGGLSAQNLRDFFLHLAEEPDVPGVRKTTRSLATINKHRRNIGGALRWIDELRPKQIPDFQAFKGALRADRTGQPEPQAHSPDELRRFYHRLKEREKPGYVKEVEDRRRGKWLQPAQAEAATPLSMFFLLAALTGMRLTECLQLKWSDVDLKRGRISVYATKTGRKRVLPLTGAPEGEVAPAFVKTLARWKRAAGKRLYVLPHAQPTEESPHPKPTFDRRSWERVGEDLGLRQITPQTLRQSFVSYLSSAGVPETVAALWCGHGPAVATRHYRTQVLERRQGRSVQEAMGLTDYRK
ncbi:MAG: tyrosine-type recombinase/integrase [Planctomycetota bacterium]